MSFETFFVARIAGGSAELNCRHDSPKRTVKELPSAPNLGIFTYALGVQHVERKEYMASDVRLPAPPPGFSMSSRVQSTWLVLHSLYHPDGMYIHNVGVYLHPHRRRWQEASWLLQASHRLPSMPHPFALALMGPLPTEMR